MQTFRSQAVISVQVIREVLDQIGYLSTHHTPTSLVHLQLVTDQLDDPSLPTSPHARHSSWKAC